MTERVAGDWTRYELLTPITSPRQPEKWVWCNGGEHLEARLLSGDTMTTEMREVPCDCCKPVSQVERPMCVNCGRFDTPCHLNTKETSGDPNWPGSPCTFDPRLPVSQAEPEETK